MTEQVVTDVVVVGTGAAGLAAALAASANGADVIVLESAATAGGTTARSSGVWWVPNNSLIRALGRSDPRADAIRYMARVSYPSTYDPDHPTLGVEALFHAHLETYYDRASVVTDELTDMAAVAPTLALPATGNLRAFDSLTWPDYYATLPEDKLPTGRALLPSPRDGRRTEATDGVAFIGRMLDVLAARHIPVLLNHRATDVLVSDSNEVVGVLVAGKRSAAPWIRARKAVIFATGGFAHDRGLRERLLRTPVYGACAVPTNVGDFLRVGSALDASMAHLDRAWLVQVAFEHKLDDPFGANVISALPGDSMILVDRQGTRVVNEKTHYQDRAAVHFARDAADSFPNRVLFMICDRRTAERCLPVSDGGGASAATERRPGLGGIRSTHVLVGSTVDEVALRIGERLASLSDKTDDLRLSPFFAENLRRTVERFNGYARTGMDREFHRGETAGDLWAEGLRPEADRSNPTMFPLSTDGPYYGVLIGGGIRDTNGGPVTNARGQVLGTTGALIPGLYGAGNCVAAVGGPGYWGPGATIGRALTFGYLSGLHAAKERPRDVESFRLAIAHGE